MQNPHINSALALLFAMAFMAPLSPGRAAPKKTAQVEFRLDRLVPDGARFKITNHSATTITVPDIYSRYSGYPYSPAYPVGEGLRSGKWKSVGNFGSFDVLQHPYELRPNESVWFELGSWIFPRFHDCDLARLRLGKLVSQPFKIPRVRPGDIEFLRYDTQGRDLIFKIQNLGEVAAQLPALHNDEHSSFEIAEFTVKTADGRGKPGKVSLGDAYDKALLPTQAVFFKVPIEKLGAQPKGRRLQIKVGEFTSRPFTLP